MVFLRALAISLGMVAVRHRFLEPGTEDRAVGRTLGDGPALSQPHPNNSILSHVFERLIATDEKQRLMPGLAESWKVVDETVWEFKLRQGVKWHDGSPFTADDVVFSFQRAPNVPNSPSSFASAVKGKTVSKVDDHTVRITTEAVAPTLPNDVATIMIVSKKHGEDAKTEDYNSGKAAIGTGAYKFAEVHARRSHRVRAQRRLLGAEAQVDEAAVQADHGRTGARCCPARRRRRHDRGYPDGRHRAAEEGSQDPAEPGHLQPADLPVRGPRPRRDAVRHGQGRQRDQEPVQGQARAPGHDQGHQPRRHRGARHGGRRRAGGPVPARGLLRHLRQAQARGLRR